MLINHSLVDFTAGLASGAPVPGGGSASALGAALGTALASMVANLTVTKAQGEEAKELEVILQEAKDLESQLLAQVDGDAQAFSGVAKVFKMPKETEGQKAARREAMQSALREAAQAPAAVMDLTVKALGLQERLLGLGTPQAISDVGVGALLLGAALRGAYLNVLINLNGIKDQAFTIPLEARVTTSLREGEELAEKIYRQVLERLAPGEGAGQ